MRLGMALNMMDMCSHIEASLPDVEFPFLSLHDPGDAIVQFKGKCSLSLL
jgi:hypothetical protein